MKEIIEKLGQNKVTLDINANEFTELYEYIKDTGQFSKLLDIAKEYDNLKFEFIEIKEVIVPVEQVLEGPFIKGTYTEKIQFYINEHVPERIDKLLVKSLRDIAINIGINPHQTKSELREQLKTILKI